MYLFMENSMYLWICDQEFDVFIYEKFDALQEFIYGKYLILMVYLILFKYNDGINYWVI